MPNEYNLYCDESCHLENDGQKAMVLGGVWTDVTAGREASVRIKELKHKHGVSSHQELKWTKISPTNVDMYIELVDYFFDNSELHFRALVVPDKSVIDHSSYKQTHDEWYYKMYFFLLTAILSKDSRYNVYLDIKDTLGGRKIEKLHDVLANDKYDFERQVVKKVQLIRSHEVQLIQLTDILIGALMYKHRGVLNSAAKERVVKRIESRSGFTLMKNTLLTEDKFNIFVWKSSGANA